MYKLRKIMNKYCQLIWFSISRLSPSNGSKGLINALLNKRGGLLPGDIYNG